MAAVPKAFQSKSYYSVGIEIVYPKNKVMTLYFNRLITATRR